ncbi:hypothetical protein P8C59_009173 [Phyllachora maydis]|uniref:Uncharacterized protein n=1 Tax=Phyllachora maydis TaxID=1825666 RepID=A0AAD9IE78_9PEZI|nr:hypothetical protein P8C59_009173 [Phyllachora maydis]
MLKYLLPFCKSSKPRRKRRKLWLRVKVLGANRTRRNLCNVGRNYVILDLTIRSGRMPGKMDVGRQSFSHAPQSTASSPDGYDSFENTNNKKKRKIPTVADTVPNGNHALGHMTATSIMPGKSNKDVADGPASPMAPYNGAHGTATGAQNVPGPGRGRYGRVRNGRSPLRALSDSTNNHAGRNGKMRPVQWSSPASGNTGIISSAIANAEKLPHQGQENVSLLLQQQSTKSTPASTQFTFTCDSQVPGALSWPDPGGRELISAGMSNLAPTIGQAHEAWHDSAQATVSHHPPAAPAAPAEGSAQAGTAQFNAEKQEEVRKAQRKKEKKMLQRQAKERERQTKRKNMLNPPRREEMWLCEFCEYAAIFGVRPRAYEERYERKEMQERRQQQERKANLAKRLSNPRKPAKKGKAAARSSGANSVNPGHEHAQDRLTEAESSNHDLVFPTPTAEEEYFDEYDEEEEVEDYGPNHELPLEEHHPGPNGSPAVPHAQSDTGGGEAGGAA